MTQKLNIAIICDSIDTTLGGSYISAQRFAQGLSDLGHHIVWCTSNFRDENRRKDFSYAKVYEFPSSFPMGPQHVRFAYARPSRLVEIFKEEHIDIVYNIHPAPIGRQAHRAAKKLGIPMITHSHIWAQLLFPGLPAFIQNLIKKTIAWLYKKYDGIVFPTAFSKKDFDDCHLGIKEAIISNGVDTNIFHPATHESKNTFNILYVGRLDPEKHIHILLDAMHLLKLENKLGNHIKCTIVGAGSESKKLHSLTKSYGLEDKVHFTGKIPSGSKELVAQYQNSIYVLTSLYELESMTTLEAMACGCPILIANSKYSAATFFVKNNGYLFDPENPADLAEKLYQLSKDHPLLETMRKKSIEHSVNFSFRKSVEQLSDFFLSFLKK